MAFEGTADYTLDAKNRLTVPARHRTALASGVVLAKGLDACVSLWAPDDYESFKAASLGSFHPLSTERRKLSTYFSANSLPTELDSAGRVMVPGFLGEHASLDKEVTVIGAGDHLEVWDRTAWSTFNAALTDDVNEIVSSLGHPA
jgi:MraZ protein